MNTRDLEYLVAVAEELHFGRAAARCHCSQSALSGQLRKLEDSLGVTVFERTKRRVRLTEVGAGIVERARDVLRQVEALKATAAASSNPLAGKFAIGMPLTIGPFLTPRLLPAIRHYLPELALELLEDFTDHLEAQLAGGELDVAILATRPTHTTLDEIIVYDEPFWVALPHGHPLAAEDSVDVQNIDPRELLLLADGHCLRDQVYAACRLNRAQRNGRDDGGPRTQNTSLATILSLVGAGSGVTLVPAMSLSDSWVTDSGIALRREQSGTASRTVRLVYRKGYPRMALIEKLADIIAGVVPDTVQPVRR